MASSQDEGSVRSYDDTMSSLGDSTYDFIDDTSFSTTDDEGQSRMTDSVSVAGGTQEKPETRDLERTLSADNLRNRSSDDSVHESVQSFISNSTTGPDEVPTESSLQKPQAQRSDQQSPPDGESIRLQETRHGEGICGIASPSVPQNLAVTVRQHMLNRKLSVEGPYRVLYVGDLAARERVVTKIGAALAADAKVGVSGPSRYSIIPMPSADDSTYSSDPVLLDWSGHAMVVYNCLDASSGRTGSGHDSITLIMDGDLRIRSSWNGASFSISGKWEAPDVAIFYLSDNDSVSAKQTRRFARSFMARHNVPSIIISEKTSWDRPSETMMIDHHTPHVCLQTEADASTSARIVKRLPVDLSTFSRIDALQLNRNLAYLRTTSGTYRTSNEQTGKLESRGHRSHLSILTQWGLDEHLGMFTARLPYLREFITAASMLLILSLLISQLVPSSSGVTRSGPNHGLSSSCIPAFSTKATSMAPLQGKPTAVRSLTIPEVAKATTSQSVAVAKAHVDLATLLLESSPMTVNKSEKFRVHVLGDSHIILRPPQWFTALRKTPKLDFNVTQGDRVLKHAVSKLFDGVYYALELSQDDAYGLVNISVWTDSKSSIHETLQADFGNPWLRAAGWKKAASALSNSFRRDLDLIQTSMNAVYVQSSAELRSLMEQSVVKALALRNETKAISKASTNQLAKLQGLILGILNDTPSKVFQPLDQKKAMAANEISLRAARFRQDISSYVLDRAHIAQAYARAAPTMYRIHLRNSQKRALKMWWSIVGLPKQRSVSVKASGKPRISYGGRRRKQTVNE
ncbi:MAG: hypothetical protein LQ338_000605 [Usnochroma carphineum]|nr:MAG: hypothetical protein LQ338_000605 [Usnochroma carphineum]